MAEKDKQRIVYVEDDPDMVELVQMMLDERRFNIVGARDGITGLGLIHQAPTALVLLDLMLPDMGGWAVFQTMKEDPDLSEIPVIVVTAQNTPIDRILGEHIAKVQVYITKPVSPAELRGAVDRVLGSEA
ncbi:MAG: response regulator [Anaerolineae bacterium]|nr:response regulator [Anaerolineae bacterium]